MPRFFSFFLLWGFFFSNSLAKNHGLNLQVVEGSFHELIKDLSTIRLGAVICTGILINLAIFSAYRMSILTTYW